jgi:hypothetical protein
VSPNYPLQALRILFTFIITSRWRQASVLRSAKEVRVVEKNQELAWHDPSANYLSQTAGRD